MTDPMNAEFSRQTRDTNTKRLTQRQPLACIACSRSKVRCDKAIPCARCSKRRIPCEREQVEISSKRRKTSEHQYEVIPQLHDPAVDVFAGSQAPYTNQTQSGYAEGDQSLGAGNAFSAPGLVIDLQAPAEITNSYRTIHVARKTMVQNRKQAEFEDLATGIEGLAWGRHQCHRYPHRNCLQIEPQFATSSQKQLPNDIIARLPPIAVARQLVNFHLEFLSWSHNVLHAPTFLAQCDVFWASATIEDGQWLALYCAVLSSASWSVYNYPHYVGDAAVVQVAQDANLLFEVMMEILSGEGFMARHTIFSLQAICISGLVANVFGQSDLLTTLVNAGIRIAQCLGLHRIQEQESDELWEETVDKEVGRRVWWKLVELDFHSMPYTGTCCINPRHFTTRAPLNCDDIDLHEQADTNLTISSYSLIMVKMAMLIPTLLEGLWSISDLASRYEHVISIDRQMRRLVTKAPSGILRSHGTTESETEPEWLILARRTLAITAADKIIMIHRSFLLKSFESPAYLFTRTTCVSAAMTILREHDQISKSQDCPPIWVHSAFCVTAIVVICLHLLYFHASMTIEKKEDYERLIIEARTRLSLSKNDTMARRGVFLINAILDEDQFRQATRSQADGDFAKPEFVRILHRFLQQDREETHVQPRTTEFNAVATPVDQLEDFDAWYNEMFG